MKDLIQAQEKEFEVMERRVGWIPEHKERVLNWHKSSTKALLEAVIEEIGGIMSEGISLEDDRNCKRIAKLEDRTELGKLHEAMNYRINQENLKLADLQDKLKEEMSKI